MNNLTQLLLLIAGGIMLLALALVFIRFLIGPNTVNRVISFDVLTVGSLGLIALIAVFEERQMYLDVNIIYALLSFIAVVVVAKYIEKNL
ncbi:MAG: monovalent cation/H+ antiporter complex subunit F [Bacteroidales bacterium]